MKPGPAGSGFDDPAGDRLMALIGGGLVTQAIAVCAELGLVDRLADGRRTPQARAASAGCDVGGLERLMQALVAARRGEH